MAEVLSSNEIYNIRRRAKRYIKSLEKVRNKQHGRARQATNAYLRKLRSEVRKTYIKKRTSAESERTSKVAQSLKKLLPSEVQRNAQKRKNFVFQQEINAASQGQPSQIGRDTDTARDLIKIFYRATQNYWEGKSDKNQAMLEGLGVSDLREAFRLVLSKNPDAIKKMNQAKKEVKSTEEIPFFEDYESDETDGSPNYLNYVNFV